MKKPKVIYTAIFGDKLGLIPQMKFADYDLICFTNQKDLKPNGWKVKYVEPILPNDWTRSNRHIKINPHLYLKDYSLSVYIDANLLIVGNINTIEHSILKEKTMACFDHNQFINGMRDCIYDEYEAILNLYEEKGILKDNPEDMKRHINFLKHQEYPANHGLIKGSFLMRKHQDPQLIKVMEDWWDMVLNYSKRDQLSFNYAAWKNNFEYATIPGDLQKQNEYVIALGNHRKDWTWKLFKHNIKSLKSKLF